MFVWLSTSVCDYPFIHTNKFLWFNQKTSTRKTRKAEMLRLLQEIMWRCDYYLQFCLFWKSFHLWVLISHSSILCTFCSCSFAWCKARSISFLKSIYCWNWKCHFDFDKVSLGFLYGDYDDDEEIWGRSGNLLNIGKEVSV